MKSKQITAVEWLEGELHKYIAYFEGNHKASIYSIYDLLNSFEKAKAMVRQQIAEAYRQGVEEDVYNTPLKTGQEYYTETYGNP
jgi:hypothetical protein